MDDSSMLGGLCDPNERAFAAPPKAKYQATRLVVHGGVSVAIALRRDEETSRITFDYVVLDPSGLDQDGNAGEREQTKTTTVKKDLLDSNGWTDSPLCLSFPKEVRVAGEEAVPNFQLSPVDKSEQKAAAGTPESQLHPWFSSTLCLTENVTNFDVLSDGKYVYLFRQAINSKTAPENAHLKATDIGLYVDGNILCDRFILSGGILISPLEVRYRRSGQKTLALNTQDTLGMRDINDSFFCEPTISIKFVSGLEPGNFSILRTPTMTNDEFRWVFLSVQAETKQLVCYTCGVSSDGLFDVLGRVYYSCEQDHKRVFSTSAGRCTTLTDSGPWCRKLMTPVVSSSPLSERAIKLRENNIGPVLKLSHPIDLTSSVFKSGCTMEVWVLPAANTSKPGETCTIFGMKPGSGPSVVLDHEFCLGLKDPSKPGEMLFRTDRPLSAGMWHHVAVTISGTTLQTVTLVVDGEVSKPLTLKSPAGFTLQRLGSREDSEGGGFRGSMDEVRVWKHALDPATLAASKGIRATGQESLLAACWHFDEGEGRVAFDATNNGNHVNVELKNPNPTDGWTVSEAPVRRGGGLTRQILRIQQGVAITGGITVSTYFEQSTVAISSENSNNPQDGKAKAEEKPLKRCARVLVCAVASKDGTQGNRLLVLDFGLLSDGTLSDTPGVLPIPSLNLTVSSGGLPKSLSSLLFIDAQGIELFGGFLDFDGAKCGEEAPFVWEAASGTVTIYFRGLDGTLKSLPYNISRTVPVDYSATLSSHERVLAVAKLRTSKQVTLRTQKCAWADPDVAVDLTVTAKMQDNTTLTETWKGVPSDLGTFISIINGSYAADRIPDGTLASYEQFQDPQDSPTTKGMRYRIELEKPLVKTLIPGACLSIDGTRVQTTEMALVGTTSFLVTQPYRGSMDSTTHDAQSDLRANKGAIVYFLGFDHGNLVTCTGKGNDSFQNGSSIVSLAQESIVGEFKPLRGGLIQAPAESTFDAAAEAPYFSATSNSSALSLGQDTAFSMFGRAATTPACSGLTFESWIKISKDCNDTASTVVAYTSEKQARSDGGEKEIQTFVLSAAPRGNQKYSLEGNINNQLFRVDSSTVKAGQWTHVACTCKNMYSLRLGGRDYVDLGNAAEFNLADFSVMFHIQFDRLGGSEQLLLTKATSMGLPTPLQVVVTEDSRLQLVFWRDEDNDNIGQKTFTCKLPSLLRAGVAYKIFISRQMVNAKGEKAPRQGQLITMKVWSAAGKLPDPLVTPKLSDLEDASRSGNTAEDLFKDPGTAACGLTAATDAPLLLGGAPFAQGVEGKIGGFHIWSRAIEPPDDISKWRPENVAKSCVSSYSFTSPEGRVLFDDKARNHGKLRGNPRWTSSPFANDAKLSVYVNGVAQETKRITDSDDLQQPVGPHQLTLGNAIHGDSTFRYLSRKANFRGEIDELRIWEVARSLESICDALYSRLTEVPPEIAVYLPFDDVLPTSDAAATPGRHSPCIRDESINCWHLSIISAGTPAFVMSGAPVGSEAACVTQALQTGPVSQLARKVRPGSRPSVGEYGDLTIGPSGSMEGSLKRVYGFIDADSGYWVLVTGFKIGALFTEWVSQVQTSPTLIGYIEGAPPIPAENFASKDDSPSSAIRFVNATKCSYSYSSQRELGLESSISTSRGGGAKWEANLGIGATTQVASGEVNTTATTVLEVSSSSLTNEMSTATSHTTLDMRVETTGSWTAKDQDGNERYEAANTGVALVESEVADVFALRLKLRGPVKPLVAYQMRPNPDIPKDRNLVSFKINPMYTKQGCLDGRRGLEADASYPMAGQGGSPRDVSYFKPSEAYALKDRIRRAEEQLAGEHERYDVSQVNLAQSSPVSSISKGKRNKRNICNSYVWTSDGGTFQETLSTMDFVQLEVGGNSDVRMGIGGSLDLEVSVSAFMATANIDALVATHFNMMLTKEFNSETSFELQVDMPPPIDIREQDPVTKDWVKRPGTVDAYRWMSFWLEPSVDATASFFQQVVDPLWLQSSDPDASVLRSLSESLKVEKQDAKTKAWRVFHRCTYVNRVPEPIKSPTAAAAAAAAAADEQEKKGLHDFAPSWTLISALEPYVRPAKNKSEVAMYAKPLIQKLYPALEKQPRLLDQFLNVVVEYLGIPGVKSR